MSQLETVFGYTKKIEAFLEKEFNAQGRGLHAKVGSIEHRLPEALVKKIRWIATLRNNLAHTEGFTIDNITYFTNTCESVMSNLESISKQGSPLGEKQSGDWDYAAREIDHRVRKPVFSSERIAHGKKDYGRRPVIVTRKPRSKPSWVIPGAFALALVVFVLVWKADINFFMFFNNSPSTSASKNAQAIEKTDIHYPKHVDQELTQAYSDIDNGIFQYIMRNTKTWLDQQDLKENGDGTYDVQVMLHWEIPAKPVLNVLNKYFFGNGKMDLSAGMVDFSSDYKGAAYGIRIVGQDNDQGSRKTPYLHELYNYLVSRQIVIRVSIGKRSKDVTIASGRKCVASCFGVGRSQYQIHLSNKDNPQRRAKSCCN
jgi:hypothetical protein